MFIRNLTYYSVLTYVKMALNLLVVIPVLTYYLDAEDFGILALVAAVFIPLSSLTNAGTSWILSHGAYQYSKSNMRSLIFNSLALSLFVRLIIAVFVIYFINLIYKTLDDGSGILTNEHLFIYSFSFFLSSFWDIVSPLLIMQKKAREHSIFEFIIWIVNPITTTLLIVLFDFKVDSLFYGFLASSILSSIVVIIYLTIERKAKFNFSIDHMKEIIRVSLYVIPSNIIEMLLGSIEKFALANMSSTAALGVYAHSLNYKGLLVSVNRTYKNAAMPFMIKEFSKKTTSLSNDIRNKNSVWYGLMALGSIFLVFFSHTVVFILTHDKFTAAADLFSIWLLIVVFIHYGSTYTSFLIANNKIEEVSIYAAFAGIVSIIFTVILIYFLDMLGAALGAAFYIISRQFINRNFAIKYGCDYHGEKDLFIVLLVTLTSILIYGFLPLEYSFLYIFLLSFYVYKHWNFSVYVKFLMDKKSRYG